MRTRINFQAISDLAQLADYSFAFAIRAVATIGIADHLADGPRHLDDLARRANCDQQSLLRVLRALATRSVFVETPPETFGLTAMSNLLRTDHPFSLRDLFRFEPEILAMGRMDQCIITGKPSFDELFGTSYTEWLTANKKESLRFREGQRALTRLEFLGIAHSWNWTDVKSVVDVGGDDGTFLAGLLDRYSFLRGTLFDLPDAVAEASAIFKNSGVTERASIHSGNIMVDCLPRGADVYIAKRLLIGFSDQQAINALTNIYTAMKTTSRLLIIEPMGSTPDRFGLSLDLRMLVLGLGRLRTGDEYCKLLAQSQLKANSTKNVGLVTILEAVPIG